MATTASKEAAAAGAASIEAASAEAPVAATAEAAAAATSAAIATAAAAAAAALKTAGKEAKANSDISSEGTPFSESKARDLDESHALIEEVKQLEPPLQSRLTGMMLLHCCGLRISFQMGYYLVA